MARNTIEDAIDRVINTCGLESVRRRLLGQLSKGYRQRAGLAQALIHDPPVLVLDEPTIGLDPIQIREIRALIQQLAGKRTIILSTHILPEVSQICEKVVIVNEGQVVLEQDMASLKASGSTLEDVFLRVIAKAHDSNHAAEATA
jgi:ABC-2 type transport system ATP-binding protein